MPTETEAKYAVKSYDEFAKIIKDRQIMPFVKYLFEMDMSAEYFDTEDRFLSKKKAALRMRREGDKVCCCLKTSSCVKDGVFVREEYECTANNLKEGILNLAKSGAPKDIIDKLCGVHLKPLCKMEFKREGWLFSKQGLTAEFAFDAGDIYACQKSVPICEFEIELKSGDAERFRDLCKDISARFNLKSERSSKFARALEII